MVDPAERERTLERLRSIEDAYAEVAPAKLVDAARAGGPSGGSTS